MLTGDLSAVQNEVQDLREGLRAQKPLALAAIGRQLVANAHQDFLVKARGGTGADGVRWARVTPAEARRKARLGSSQAGIRTGEMRNMLVARVGGRNSFGKAITKDTVSLDYYDQPKANYFNALRPLLPNRLPNSWYRQATAIVDRHLDQIS